MNRIAPKYRVANSKDISCPICNGLNNIYKRDFFQQEMKIPEGCGKGYCRRLVIKPAREIFISDGILYEGMTIRGSRDCALNWLVFCLGDTVLWRMEGESVAHELACGESYVFSGQQGNHIYTFQPGHRFLSLGIQLDEELIASAGQLSGASAKSNNLKKKKISNSLRLIINEIINCRYTGSLKKLYLEGKVLELAAMYFDEAVFENIRQDLRVKLSSFDVTALHHAKRVLDDNIVSPPTIKGLSRLICLNEYKLKTGFKELFGMPVHAYIIDRRLEMVRFLLTEKRLKVSEAVLLAGYNDTSHFAEKFRKKYGINPSAYAKK